jgi:hypothetical protein
VVDTVEHHGVRREAVRTGKYPRLRIPSDGMTRGALLLDLALPDRAATHPQSE